MQDPSVFLPGKFHGQKSLVDCNPWDHRVRHNWMSDSMHANAKFSSENVNKYTFYQKSPPEFINFEGHWLLLVLT